jgi:hypothetical protein
VSAGPWTAEYAFGRAEELHRYAAPRLFLWASPLVSGEWEWQAMDENDRSAVVAAGDEPTLPAAMEAADLWASENGYPAVRVEVDP